MDWLFNMFRSKKFFATILGVLIPLFNSWFGWNLNIETIITMLGTLGVYTISQGIADAGSKGATSNMAAFNNGKVTK